MHQSISSNATIYFGECLEVFGYSGIQVSRVQHNNNNNNNNGALVARGVQKGRFQQSDTTHSGTGEKETPNINVVGIIGAKILIKCNVTFIRSIT